MTEQAEAKLVKWSDARLRGIASDYFPNEKDWAAAILCLRHLLKEQKEQKPVAVVVLRLERVGFGRVIERKDVQFFADLPLSTKLYTYPPRREWRSLSKKEIAEIALQSQDGFSPHDDTQRFAQAIEARLKEKNHEH
jgi:hypothetical protein